VVKIMQTVRVAAIQPAPVSKTMNDFLEGREIGHAMDLLDRLSVEAVDIACFSELYPMVGEAELCRKARSLGFYIIAGLLEPTPDGYYNTATIIAPDGGIVGRQRKRFPTSLELALGIQKWDGPCEVFSTDRGRLGILICSDFAFFNDGIRQLVEQKVDIVFNPSWWFAIGEAYSSTVISRHLEYGVPIVGVDIAKFALKATIEGRLVQFPAAGGYSTVAVPPRVASLQELSDWFQSMPGGSNSLKGFVQMLGEPEGILIEAIELEAARRFPGYFYNEGRGA
jgi:predicted amidohydrolase